MIQGSAQATLNLCMPLKAALFPGHTEVNFHVKSSAEQICLDGENKGGFQDKHAVSEKKTMLFSCHAFSRVLPESDLNLSSVP